MYTEENNKNELSNFVAFIPNRLIIPDRPELAQFSLNILIGRYTARNCQPVLGNVLYEPDLNSFTKDESGMSINYQNPNDGASWIKLTVKGDEYEAVKYFCGKEVRMSEGKIRGLDDAQGWQQFFIHVGLLGFADGEVVMYDQVKGKDNN